MTTPLTVVDLNGINGAEYPVPENPDVTGNTIVNSPIGRVFCRITNNDATNDITVTAVTTTTVDEGNSGKLAVEDPSRNILAGESWVIGPWSVNFGATVTLTWADVGPTPPQVPLADIDIETYRIV